MKRQKDANQKEILEKDKQIAILQRDLDNFRQIHAIDASHYKQEIFKLKEDLARVEAEKQYAQTRLSALMSVKLRDNNPDIADLSDPYRPTKLAEMFSELYDNEWTDAFTAVREGFSERQTTTLLLDIIMGAHSFCTEEMDMSWSVVSEWFLDPSSANEQQIRKLKNTRKVAVVRMTDKISKKYHAHISSICVDPTLLGILYSKALEKYVLQSIRLCLLMCANDPPVVIKCQDLNQSDGDHKPKRKISNVNVIKSEIDEKDMIQIDQGPTNTEDQHMGETRLTGEEFQNNLEKQAPEEKSNNEEQASGAVNIHTEKEQPLCVETNKEGSQTSGTMREIENESGVQHNPKRQPFDKDKFKEYTS